ncbi:precorrin-6y C5,15-methyltransferase (decarboxylating) subunit CbiE [Leptospira langatensis]|uniref:Precorrin-6y C5,15-methyltransferase (Decarboxylating) subunit CbiE n=1 Tax=Leptospira langatensis TaxID=2484983 RepID=A0A5F1ZXD6_9LEPT|nr:precorrin-6y C5,15-methyltransferase (decarboxylating) subunit CbiE [Leptospira langatensis]TGJ98433.1 precorrin-6y C5,15-methyltransferase (decarboxylating) subunit CbiE [Leptospira langatensis]TGL43348.1 precorrin-6y C5,15-methyltransferase (decarboxylating) subunit CbiE [Leptospira langatensis]
MKAVTVVGIGDDGCVGLSSKAMGAVARARVLAGGERHLDFFPQFDGERIVIKGDLLKSADRIAELSAEHTVCVLASGDPLFFGIGTLIIRKVGKEHVEFIPAPSSIQNAFSRIGVKWDDAEILSFHGRPIKGLITKLQTLSKLACLTDDSNSPSKIAKYLLSYGESDWRVFVCENLCGKEERIREFTVEELSETEGISDLNVLILLRKNPDWRPTPLLPFQGEDEYAKRLPKKGLITKKEVRILSLSALELRPDSVVWDIGAGSGAVSIEAAKIAREGRVHAIEIDPEGIEICEQNILSHKADNVSIIHGRAPEALEGLEEPDAVFIGGSKGSLNEIIHFSLARLKTGGCLVVNAITLDNVSEAYQIFRELGYLPEVTLVQISRGQKLADYLRYEALNPIHIFKIRKL